MKISDTFVKILGLDMAAGNTVFLAGEPGIGKTSIVKSLARATDSKCFVVQVNQLADKADLTGARLVPTDDKKSFEQKFFAHHKVRAAVQYANDNPRSTVYLLLDEINRTTPDVTSGALSISTERELGDQVLPNNLKILVTGNTKGNVVALDDASLSRFAVYQVEPDAQSVIEYLDSRDNGTRPLNDWVRAVLTKNPESVFEKSAPLSFTAVDGSDDDDDSQTATFADLMDAGEEMLQLTTPRTIEAISNFLEEADPDLLKELFQTPVDAGARTGVTMLHEIVEAHVGLTTFSTMLIGEIGASFAQASAGGKSRKATAPRPGCWDDLAAAGSNSALDGLISQLNDHEKSGALVYAIYDSSDNAAIIRQLVAQTDQLETDHGTTLLSLMTSGGLNEDNLRAALDTNAPIVEQRIRPVANMIGINA